MSLFQKIQKVFFDHMYNTIAVIQKIFEMLMEHSNEFKK